MDDDLLQDIGVIFLAAILAVSIHVMRRHPAARIVSPGDATIPLSLIS